MARELWHAAEWYRALTLTERFGAGAPSAPPTSGPEVDQACDRLRAWKLQKPFSDGSLFADRLAVDDVSESELLALLAESAESVKGRAAASPPWLTALADAFDDDPGQELLASLDGIETEHPLRECLTALAPLLSRALGRLVVRVEELRRTYGQVALSTDVLTRSFLTNLAPTVLFQMSKPVVLEMHIARSGGELRGETSEARFEDFMRSLAEGGVVPLLLEYPVLARQVVTTVDQWADYLGEFATHLCSDWDELSAAFAHGGDPGAVVELDAGRGDRHRRGRSVLLVRFSSGMRLLYKPKPLAVDLHFQQLLSWLNERGAEPALRPITVLDGGEYGWCEHVAASSCTSDEEVARFYERQGSYLALLYALDATDVHGENLIAAGEHPVLVDLEALFHPHVHGQDPVLAGNAAAAALDDSVWQVGMLPRREWSDEHSVGVDMSGLGGQSGQMNPHRLVSWEQPRTDQMRLGRRRVELPTSENRPRVGDAEVDVLHYGDAILAGFTRTYRLLCRHRDALLSEQLPRFSRDTIRVLVRSTNVYSLLWYEGFHPDVLRDGLDRDRYLDRLWGAIAQRPYLARVVRAEHDDLMRGDIPFFSTSPDSRTIFTSEGEPVVDFLDSPSLDLVRRRVQQLGEEDLARQTWIIEASLATLQMQSGDPYRTPRPPADHVPAPDRDRLIARARAVAQRLDELALQSSVGASWLGVGPLDDTRWALYPTGTDLYAGNAGIALFLAHLGAVTGEPSPTLLAEQALRSLRSQVRTFLDLEPGQQDAFSAGPIGGFEGLGSVVHVLSHLGALWREPGLLDDAEEVAAMLPALISRDERLDVVYGSAGCLLALLSLHAARPSARTLALASRCGERLLAAAQPVSGGSAWTTLPGQPPLGGFSHGTAGIAFSLLRLAGACGDDRFRRCALDALTFDRSLFFPDSDNWADARVFPSDGRTGDEAGTEAARKSMVAWCHGAPGIGLGRLAALDQLDDAVVRDEIDAALRATVRQGFVMNHSLCHGGIGNLELLLAAARTLDRPEDHEALERATADVLATLEHDGPVTGVPMAVETPGLMTGLAGIGYGLLRLAEPERVPSVLLLAPPTAPARA